MSDLQCMTLQGTAVYVPEKEALVWKIKSFPGGREFLLRAKFSLPSVAAEEEPRGRMPPMRVNFEIPYFTVSGIQVLHCLPQLPGSGTAHLANPIHTFARFPAMPNTQCDSRKPWKRGIRPRS